MSQAAVSGIPNEAPDVSIIHPHISAHADWLSEKAGQEEVEESRVDYRDAQISLLKLINIEDFILLQKKDEGRLYTYGVWMKNVTLMIIHMVNLTSPRGTLVEFLHPYASLHIL